VWDPKAALSTAECECSDTACEPKFVSQLVDLHDNLLGGNAGRMANGIGAVVLALMRLTGVVLWWPGTDRWRRSITLRRNVDRRHFTRDVHTTMAARMR
jgi:uncharacterized iron-regulated membrane protein